MRRVSGDNVPHESLTNHDDSPNNAEGRHLATQFAALLCKSFISMERVKGIEPSSQPWEGHILPLNHTRFRLVKSNKTKRSLQLLSLWRSGRAARCAVHAVFSGACQNVRTLHFAR